MFLCLQKKDSCLFYGDKDLCINHCVIIAIFHRSGDRVPLLCIDKHPTQPHLIVTGGQDGVLGLWDMRQERYPVTLLEAHSDESKTNFY